MPEFAFITSSSHMSIGDGPSVFEQSIVHVAVAYLVGQAVEAIDFEHEFFGVVNREFFAENS